MFLSDLFVNCPLAAALGLSSETPPSQHGCVAGNHRVAVDGAQRLSSNLRSRQQTLRDRDGGGLTVHADSPCVCCAPAAGTAAARSSGLEGLGSACLVA